MIQKQFKGEYDFDFKGEQDIFNFVVGVGKKIANGTLTKSEMAAAQENISLNSLIKETPEGTNEKIEKDSINYSRAEDASNKPQYNNLQELYDKYDGNVTKLVNETLTYNSKGKDVKGRVEDSIFGTQVIKLATSIKQRLFSKIKPDSLKGVTETEYLRAIITNASLQMADFKPGKGQTVYQYMSFIMNARANSLAKELGVESTQEKGGLGFTSDATLQKDLMSDETAEDSMLASEEIAKEKPKKEKPKLKEKISFPAELTEEINVAIGKFTSLASKKFTEETSKNRTSANYVNDIKADLAESLRKPIAKYIKEQGLEQFLIENRETILDNFTTTFLSKHPFFRKGILKRVNGEWVAPTRISAYKYDWVDAKGNKLKIDRDNASARGLTSGPEFIKRNPKIKEILKENEYVDYHFQDGAQRGSVKINALDSLARQLAAEVGFEILQ